MALTYSSYLKVEELLGLQQPVSDPPEHDETLFIIVHQTYELWFKQLLHEFDRVGEHFVEDRLFEAIHTFKRCRMIMKTLVAQLDILETMTPMSFLTFRDRLDQASGFQSMQFRQLEFLLGYKREGLLDHVPAGMFGRDRAERRYREPSVVDHFYTFLDGRGVAIPPAVRSGPPTAATRPNEQIQDALVRLFTTDPSMAILFELMTDFDEGLQEWRYRHVKMVERTIGNRQGTGGSMGVEFLKRSLFTPVFPDLWAIRHRL